MKSIKSEQEQALEMLRASLPPSFHEYVNGQQDGLSPQERKEQEVGMTLGEQIF